MSPWIERGRHVDMALSSGPACRKSRGHRQGRAGPGVPVLKGKATLRGKTPTSKPHRAATDLRKITSAGHKGQRGTGNQHNSAPDQPDRRPVRPDKPAARRPADLSARLPAHLSRDGHPVAGVVIRYRHDEFKGRIVIRHPSPAFCMDNETSRLPPPSSIINTVPLIRTMVPVASCRYRYNAMLPSCRVSA